MLRAIGLAVGLVLAGLAMSPSQHVAAAYDCVTTHRLSIDVLDLNNERVGFVGGQATVLNDPQDGLGSRLYVDQGQNDDSILTGRMQEDRACGTTEGSLYTIVLSFDESRVTCQVSAQDNGQVGVTTPLTTDTTVTFHVHDCLVPQPTVTPTSTSTPTNTPLATATATATVTPVPTATSVPFIPCNGGGVTIFPFPCPTVAVPVAPTQVAVVVPTATVTTTAIRPPNTGDAGLLGGQ